MASHGEADSFVELDRAVIAAGHHQIQRADATMLRP